MSSLISWFSRPKHALLAAGVALGVHIIQRTTGAKWWIATAAAAGTVYAVKAIAARLAPNAILVVQPPADEHPMVTEILGTPARFSKRDLRGPVKDAEVVREKLEKERAAAQAGVDEGGNDGFFDEVGRMSPLSTSETIVVRGREVGIAHDQGQRPEMEDEHLALADTAKGEPYELYAVFDGHGGAGTAKFLRENLNRFVREALETMPDRSDVSIWNALKSACVECDKRAKTFGRVLSGSTAVIALRIDGDLWIANVGDSRAILRSPDGRVEQISEDAKPGKLKYWTSIKKRGGTVSRINEWDREVSWNEPGIDRVNRSLSIARSFNDRVLRSPDHEIYAISPRPKIVKVPKVSGHLILCCDGVAEVASSRNIGDRAGGLTGQPPEAIAADLVGAAYRAGSTDNLTVLVVSL